MTSTYEFTGAALSSSQFRTHTKYRRPVAAVIGEDRGVPFRIVFKTWSAAQRLHERVFGSVLINL